MSEWRSTTNLSGLEECEPVQLWPGYYGIVTVGEWRGGTWFLDLLNLDADGCPETISPTHWAPLLEPPQGQK